MTDSSSKQTPCKRVFSFLRADSQELQTLFTKIKLLDELNKKMLALLPPTIQKYCQVANLSGDCLVLITANGTVATDIRFKASTLLLQLKQDPALQKIHAVQRIRTIECKVRPVSSQHNSSIQPPAAMASLSQSTAHVVEDIAATIDYPKLRAVMLKIAKHVKQRV